MNFIKKWKLHENLPLSILAKRLFVGEILDLFQPKSKSSPDFLARKNIFRLYGARGHEHAPNNDLFWLTIWCLLCMKFGTDSLKKILIRQKECCNIEFYCLLSLPSSKYIDHSGLTCTYYSRIECRYSNGVGSFASYHLDKDIYPQLGNLTPTSRLYEYSTCVTDFSESDIHFSSHWTPYTHKTHWKRHIECYFHAYPASAVMWAWRHDGRLPVLRQLQHDPVIFISFTVTWYKAWNSSNNMKIKFVHIFHIPYLLQVIIIIRYIQSIALFSFL